jgi:hypothetical protein
MTKPKYIVYVDESFDRFMNFPELEGNFCYSALMVPTGKINELTCFWHALESRIRVRYLQIAGRSIDSEVKSKHVRRLSLDERFDIFKRISYCLTKNHMFIGGFFTSVHGLLCYELRSYQAFDGCATMLDYNREKLEQMKSKLDSAKQVTIGEGHLLSGLFQTITTVPFHWLGSMGAQCSICYDSRDKNEDPITFEITEKMLPKMHRVHPKYKDVYQGVIAEDSATVPGLMLVDLICSEMRRFFVRLPLLLTDQCGLRLITPTSMEGRMIPDNIGGRFLKWGSSKSMSSSTVDALVAAEQADPFTTLLPNLAAQKLSCYAHFGEARVIDFATTCFNDMVD